MWLANVASDGKTGRKVAKTGTYVLLPEDFEPLFNAVLPSLAVSLVDLARCGNIHATIHISNLTRYTWG